VRRRRIVDHLPVVDKRIIGTKPSGHHRSIGLL
jgi:hypothetical protein